MVEDSKNSQMPTINSAEQKINTFAQTKFGSQMEDVKINVLKQAEQEDVKFVDTIKSNLKQAAVKHTEVEKSKADFEKQQVDAESEKLTRQQEKNKQGMFEDKWQNRQKMRQYVFDGVKPIMTFVGIENPFSVILMILFTVLLILPFFVYKLWNGTFGLLIYGACDKDRSKAMKGILWTLLVFIVLGAMFVAIYLFLNSQGIDILAKLK